MPRTSVQKRAYDAVRAETARLGPGAMLPSQNELADQLGISRDSVQRALSRAKSEGLVVPVQGRGTYVAGEADQAVAAPGAEAAPAPGADDSLEPAIIGLDHYLDLAFQEQRVTIDFFGFTAETLTTLLKPRLDRLRVDGASRPEALEVRLLLPATGAHLALPRSLQDWSDERPLNRLREMTAGFVRALETSMSDIAGRGLIETVSLLVRTVRITPPVKLYIINGTTALQSWYEIQSNTIDVPVPGGGGGTEKLPIHDLMGLDALLIPQTPDAVAAAQRWFDSHWTTIATEWPGEPAPDRPLD